MRYPIAIEPGDERHAFGVVVPDLPGCFSAGDTLDEAVTGAKESIELWLETVLEDCTEVPEPSPIAKHQADPEFAGWIWAVVEVDVAKISKARRVNITLPERVLAAVDKAAERFGDSRSGLLAKAALEYIERHRAA